MPRLRPDGSQQVHETLERHVGVLESGQVDIAYSIQQCVEALLRANLGAQHQGIDEHPDQIVQLAPSTTRHRSPDHHIAAAAQPRQQHRQCGVHHHERRRPVRTRACLDGVGQRSIHSRNTFRSPM